MENDEQYTSALRSIFLSFIVHNVQFYIVKITILFIYTNITSINHSII